MTDAKPDKCKLLLVDDDQNVLLMLQEIFHTEYETLGASSGAESIEMVRQNRDIAAVVMDIKMSDIDGIAAAREIRNIDPDVAIIFHTAYPGEFAPDEIDEQEKPFDYIEKGEPISKLTRSVKNAVDSWLLKKQNRDFSTMAELDYGLIGRSGVMQEVYQMIRRVSQSDSKVIIMGETGTGKELVARALHFNSRRKDNRFAFFSCHHKAPDIVESELFGHVKGAFTGAVSDRVGLFEYAEGGTVFLDEIGDLDISTQGKLLRVLETGEYQLLGSPTVKTTDVRILCATNKNLEHLIEAGQFRDDLYFRLKGIRISLPPLRDRKEDIPLLIDKFKDKFTIEEGCSPKVFDRSAISVLLDFGWPGNVRQLLDTVQSLMVLSDSDIIFGEEVRTFLGQAIGEHDGDLGEPRSLTQRVREFRRNCIIEALHETHFNISAAAILLKVDRANLRKWIKSLKINMR